MKYIHFYATANDLLPALQRLEQDQKIKYVQNGKRSEINRPIYLNCIEIPDLGVATNESGSLSITYVVSRRDIKNTLHVLYNEDGQKRWLLSNGDNPDSVLLTAAGLWKTGTLLPGNMSTLHNTPTAQRIMTCFSEAIKDEHFFKSGIYWFGREAVEFLKDGRRLVQSEQSPPSYDVCAADVLAQTGTFDSRPR